MIKYYVWENNDRICEFDEDEFMDAIKYAIEHKATDVEKTIWNTRESYNNYEPADEFIKVWQEEIKMQNITMNNGYQIFASDINLLKELQEDDTNINWALFKADDDFYSNTDEHYQVLDINHTDKYVILFQKSVDNWLKQVYTRYIN